MTLARLFPVLVVAGFVALAATAISQAAANPLADAVKRSTAERTVVISQRGGDVSATHDRDGHYDYIGSRSMGFEVLSKGRDKDFIGVDGCWYDGSNGDVSKQTKDKKGEVVSKVLGAVFLLGDLKRRGAAAVVLDDLRTTFASVRPVRRGDTLTARTKDDSLTVTLDRSGRIAHYVLVSKTDDGGAFDVTYPASVRRLSARPLCRI